MQPRLERERPARRDEVTPLQRDLLYQSLSIVEFPELRGAAIGIEEIDADRLTAKVAVASPKHEETELAIRFRLLLPR